MINKKLRVFLFCIIYFYSLLLSLFYFLINFSFVFIRFDNLFAGTFSPKMHYCRLSCFSTNLCGSADLASTRYKAQLFSSTDFFLSVYKMLGYGAVAAIRPTPSPSSSSSWLPRLEHNQRAHHHLHLTSLSSAASPPFHLYHAHSTQSTRHCLRMLTQRTRTIVLRAFQHLLTIFPFLSKRASHP